MQCSTLFLMSEKSVIRISSTPLHRMVANSLWPDGICFIRSSNGHRIQIFCARGSWMPLKASRTEDLPTWKQNDKLEMIYGRNDVHVLTDWSPATTMCGREIFSWYNISLMSSTILRRFRDSAVFSWSLSIPISYCGWDAAWSGQLSSLVAGSPLDITDIEPAYWCRSAMLLVLYGLFVSVRTLKLSLNLLIWRIPVDE